MTSNTTITAAYDEIFTAEEEAILAQKEAAAEHLSERNGGVPEALNDHADGRRDDVVQQPLAA